VCVCARACACVKYVTGNEAGINETDIIFQKALVHLRLINCLIFLTWPFSSDTINDNIRFAIVRPRPVQIRSDTVLPSL